MWFSIIVRKWGGGFVFQLVLLSNIWWLASSLGSMSSIAISYGENGSVFCSIKPDGSHLVSCYGSNSAIIYGTPSHLEFIGLTAGDGFMCGLLMDSNQPYCWGNSGYIQMGVPQPMHSEAEYVEISAGDYHLCALRKPLTGRRRNNAFVDCWGYNLTKSFEFDGQFDSITAGSEFNCGLFSQNTSVFCWGEESTSQVISLVPKEIRFKNIAAGGYHVCGILDGLFSRVFCWGKSLEFEQEIDVSYSGQQHINVAPPKDQMISVVGGRFHACGIKSSDHNVICWGFIVKPSTPAPANTKFYQIAAGNYFTCGVAAEKPLSPICWGAGFPNSLPLAVSPGQCRSTPCALGFYKFPSQEDNSPCKSPGTHLCVPCSKTCSVEMYQKTECTVESDRVCDYNCSSCFSNECITECRSPSSVVASNRKGIRGFQTVQLPIIVTVMAVVVFVTVIVSAVAIVYVRYRLKNCRCLATRKLGRNDSSLAREIRKVRPDLDDMKISRARAFTYDELERATGGFKEESLIGKGSFSCVYKGILKDGTVVAVKKAIISSSSDKQQKNSREFHTELDLLSRLNHAHLLNLLGYCEEGEERLLVYEYMANGSLHQQLHGENKDKSMLDWIRRVTIAVQAARGIEYLHGYACPPVIHRDIKSSNILIDEDHNARVADFGLSLLGPTDSSSPLAELPAGTLGYLDPEYYRLHYLTTKSDVYSFGVLLLEILSGRKAIDVRYEERNVVEWAVPMIKSGDISMILDPSLDPPSDAEALRQIANVACKCVRMRGKERPSMEKVTTALERSLAQLMGRRECCDNDRLPILPSEVVLGSSRMHKKSSRMSSNVSVAETADTNAEGEFRAPSWITFPSVTSSSQRRKSSASEADVEGRITETVNAARNANVGGGGGGYGDALRRLEEEIGPASPQESLFLQHNF